MVESTKIGKLSLVGNLEFRPKTPPEKVIGVPTNICKSAPSIVLLKDKHVVQTNGNLEKKWVMRESLEA